MNNPETRSKSAAVILWDLVELEATTLPLVVHGDSVMDVVFSPDGKQVYSLGLDGDLSVMPVSTKGLQALACRIANRNLTPDEVREYDGLDEFIQLCSKILGDGWICAGWLESVAATPQAGEASPQRV